MIACSPERWNNGKGENDPDSCLAIFHSSSFPKGEGSVSFVFSQLYGTPAPIAESQDSEAWPLPARIYGHLRGVSLNLTGIISNIKLILILDI